MMELLIVSKKYNTKKGEYKNMKVILEHHQDFEIRKSYESLINSDKHCIILKNYLHDKELVLVIRGQECHYLYYTESRLLCKEPSIVNYMDNFIKRYDSVYFDDMSNILKDCLKYSDIHGVEANYSCSVASILKCYENKEICAVKNKQNDVFIICRYNGYYMLLDFNKFRMVYDMQKNVDYKFTREQLIEYINTCMLNKVYCHNSFFSFMKEFTSSGVSDRE